MFHSNIIEHFHSTLLIIIALEHAIEHKDLQTKGKISIKINELDWMGSKM
jgi:hypothetical protein